MVQAVLKDFYFILNRKSFTVLSSELSLIFMFIYLFMCSFIYLWLFGSTPAVYGDFQARGRIGAAAGSLHHSHAGSEPEIELASSWILVGFVTTQSQWELLIFIFNQSLWVSPDGAVEMNPTRSHEVAGTIPGLSQWVKVSCCRALWCRLQMQLGSCIAVSVVQASSCSSDLTPSWEPPYAMGVVLKKKIALVALWRIDQIGRPTRSIETSSEAIAMVQVRHAGCLDEGSGYRHEEKERYILLT